MIDCNIAKNYLKERTRMCSMFFLRNCKGCVYHDKDGCWRGTREQKNPETAIEIVQDWSNANPQKTLLTEFLRNYPNAEMNSDGFPNNIVPCSLGLIERKDICKNRCLYYYDKGYPCYDCWNTPIKESDENNA